MHILVAIGHLGIVHLVFVEKLQRDELPLHVVLTKLLHLRDPPRRNPRPRTYRVEEEVEVGHCLHSCDFALFECFDEVARLEVLEVGKSDTAFKAFTYFTDIVLKAAK